MENQPQADETANQEGVEEQQKQDNVIQSPEKVVENNASSSHLSPTKSQQDNFLKPRSPLGFLKQRMGSSKKRRESGHSEGADSESGSSNVDDAERRKSASSSDCTSGNLSLSLDSSPQPNSKESKPRRGIAKVFHDLRYRSRIHKSVSAPATSPMEGNNSVRASMVSSVEVDDISNSSYATPMSGYSTPVLSESMVTSPETSISESTEHHEDDDAEKTVQNSPAAEVMRSSSAPETPPVVVAGETRPLDETPQKPGDLQQESQTEAAPDGGDQQQSSTRPLTQHRASVPSSTRELQERPSSANEIRFCFTEHRIVGDSPSSISSTSNNNKISPSRGLMRSLPADTSDMETAGTPNSGYPKNEHLYKVLVIGELGTGKTSIIKRYVHQFFSQHYRATIGVDFALKVVHWDQSTVIRLQLWDIAGQERFGNMTRVYYKEAVGAFIVFDVTRASTFESVAKWKLDLDAKVQLPDGNPIPCVLLANKCDQPKEGIAANKAKMDEYCQEKGFAGWFETSAKDNINIDDAAKFLVGRILENDHWSNSTKEEDADRLDLHSRAQGEGAGSAEKRKACC